MNNVFGMTAAIEEAEYSAKKRSFIKVTFIFILVYIIGTIVSSTLLSIPMTAYIFTELGTNSELLNAAASGDMAKYNEAYNNFVEDISVNMPEWLNASALFCTAGLIATVMIYCLKLERRRLFTLGFVKKGALGEYAVGLLVGLLMFGAVYAIMIISGGAEFKGFNPILPIGIIILFFVGYLIQGMSEEILMRGYFFVSASYSSKSIPLAIISSSAFFAFLHVSNEGVNPLGILNIFLFGIFAALYFLRRGSIWGIAAIHSIWNFAQGNIFGCLVSGNESGSSIISSSFSAERAIFNGGSFGPEGGIGVSIVLIIGITVLLFMKNKEVTPEYSMNFQSA